MMSQKVLGMIKVSASKWLFVRMYVIQDSPANWNDWQSGNHSNRLLSHGCNKPWLLLAKVTLATAYYCPSCFHYADLRSIKKQNWQLCSAIQNEIHLCICHVLLTQSDLHHIEGIRVFLNQIMHSLGIKPMTWALVYACNDLHGSKRQQDAKCNGPWCMTHQQCFLS